MAKQVAARMILTDFPLYRIRFRLQNEDTKLVSSPKWRLLLSFIGTVS